MRTVRKILSKTVPVAKCPLCGKEHSFDFQLIIEEVVDVVFMMTSRSESKSCAVICPNKQAEFVVDVPVTLWSGQSLLEVK